uniref:Uncharacterized protein n=1 Tax=Arundo donax TaxID=35708 RepID=A0A0A9BPZ2_ARUDO
MITKFTNLAGNGRLAWIHQGLMCWGV